MMPRTVHRDRFHRPALALLVAALVAAVGAWPVRGPAQTAAGTVQEKLGQLRRLSGAERQRFLEEQAIREGKVVMYTSDDPEVVRRWSAAFKKRYPQIDAQFVRMRTATVLQRTVGESQAGQPTTDLVHLSGTGLSLLEQRSMLARYVSPEAAAFDPEFKDPEELWTAEWLDLLVVAFNTTLVKRAEAPTTLEALAAGGLKGKLATTAPGGPAWVAGVLKARGEGPGMELIRKVAAQQPRLYDSNSALGDALASGQVAIAYHLLLNDAATKKEAGAPVDYVVPDPLFVSTFYQVIMKDAPHPFAAALVYDWILSKEGQSVYKELGFLGPRKDTPYSEVHVQALAAARREGKTVIDLSADLLANAPRDTKIFEDLFVRR